MSSPGANRDIKSSEPEEIPSGLCLSTITRLVFIKGDIINEKKNAREKALQALYQIDMSGAEPSEALNLCWKKKKTDLFLQTIDRRYNRTSG